LSKLEPKIIPEEVLGDGPLGYQKVLGAEGPSDNMSEGASKGGDDPRNFPEQEEEEES